MEDAIYGGRIDNAFDLRVLRSYLRYVRMYVRMHVRTCVCMYIRTYVTNIDINTSYHTHNAESCYIALLGIYICPVWYIGACVALPLH